ncbi:MAG: MutH/Sau3AI family endonuclease [Candidatus Pacebacteria bacterium]|nr:MutH/Sau3AI family endonuclease [Candidatus Paceibacterota bacterium]
MKTITREEAVAELQKFIGEDLRVLSDKYNVTVFKNGKLNKGWAGHVLEHCLGLGLNCRQAPNGESWELKLVPLKKKDGKYVPKETMAITMINAQNVAETEFENSHLLKKLESLIICGREFESKEEKRSILISVGTFDLVDKKIKKQVEEDYELVKETIKKKGFDHLTGKMGELVQPRTKGPGHGSISRAFYARTKFVKLILGLK